MTPWPKFPRPPKGPRRGAGVALHGDGLSLEARGEGMKAPEPLGAGFGFWPLRELWPTQIRRGFHCEKKWKNGIRRKIGGGESEGENGTDSDE